MNFKIATWNINSVKMRLSHLREFLLAANPDILLLQELKCETNKFPYEELADLPYNIYVHGQKSYNGVAIVSKFPADDINAISYDFFGNPCPQQARFIEASFQTPIGFCQVASLYAPNGGEVDSDKFQLKLEFYDALIAYVESQKSFDKKLIIGGDFNIAPFDIDVYSPISLAQTTCCTKREKQKIRTLLNYGLEDLYRLAHPQQQEFSWWDYRAGAFEQNKGMRIDMLLASSNVADRLHNCYIDYQLRAKTSPSDHAPVVAY